MAAPVLNLTASAARTMLSSTASSSLCKEGMESWKIGLVILGVMIVAGLFTAGVVVYFHSRWLLRRLMSCQQWQLGQCIREEAERVDLEFTPEWRL
ncbi:hypothetical protein WAI453_012734 [Rhynchosporium graminicola]